MSTSDKLVVQKEVREWARKMHYNGAVVIDTEATGGAFQDEVFEIAVVRLVDNKVLFDQLFEPERPISWYSTKVHGLITKDLKGLPKFTDYWNELYNLLDNVPVLAFNSLFDKRVLQQTCERYSLKNPNAFYECIMKMYGKFVGRRAGLSLAAVCEELQIPGGTHRAKEDAIAAAGIVQKLAL